MAKAIVTQAIRPVVLCKDKDGKCGLRLQAVDNGIFVCYVGANSPAALAGLRFGDQVLEINNVSLAGMTMDQCHAILKKAPTNGIAMAVRDRYLNFFFLFCISVGRQMYLKINPLFQTF